MRRKPAATGAEQGEHAEDSAAGRGKRSGSVLAFDFGEKRIGVAVGELAVGIAHPLTTIAAEDNATRFSAIATLITEWRPAVLAVGLPMHADGVEHGMSRLARRFARRLEGRFGIAVEFVDERLTSRAAESRLRETGVNAARARQALDAAAAREILEAYFESLRCSPHRLADDS